MAENEIVEGEIVETEDEQEEDTANTLYVTGFNENTVVKPVECGACGAAFYAKPDDIGEPDAEGEIECALNGCPYCLTEFENVNTEF